ncbi:hypothetical protein [Prevotella sp.]|uniref:hypothetical protein n=1 Tax=Prevotella sp. TaxID=59823 RepID=UPI0027E2CE3E|nr:hypothetical protein [Prevotella sp.]
MPIEPHIENLQLKHPEEPLEIIRLACFLGDDIAKTKAYASILQTCNDYRDIAYKVVKDMYVKCLIDKITAKKERTFITYLLALCPYLKDGNPHSLCYHINLMLESPEVKKEREEYDRKHRNEWNGGNNGGDKKRVTIEISSKYREVTMPIIHSLVQSGAITLVEAKLNTQRKLNKSIRYVVNGSGEEITHFVTAVDLNVRRMIDFTPKRRRITSCPNRNRFLDIKPCKLIMVPGDKNEVPGNPNINKLRTLVQQQYGLTGREIVAQSAEPARRIRYEKVLGHGIRVIVD